MAKMAKIDEKMSKQTQSVQRTQVQHF